MRATLSGVWILPVGRVQQMVMLEIVFHRRDLRASPCFAASGSDGRLTAKGGGYNEVRPNLLHVTDYGIGLCFQPLNVVESSLGYIVMRDVRLLTRKMEEWLAHMHQLPSSSSDVPLRVLVLAVGSLGTARVLASAKNRKQVTGKAAADSHSTI